jgi:hypothetical protein
MRRIAMPFLAILGFAIGVGPAAAQQQQRQQQRQGPGTQYVMDVATHALAGMPAGMTLPGMGGSNGYGMSRGGAPGKYADLALLVRGRPGVRGTHTIPPGMNMGASLPLLPPPGGRAESEVDRMEKPRGRLLVYWGCDANVRPGQPRIVDVAASPAAYGPAMMGRYGGGRPAGGPGWSLWPNQEERRAVPANASLVGDHRIGGDGVPAGMAFAIPATHDFMPQVEVTGTGSLGASIPLEWRAVAGATGYFGHAMASKGNDMILWTSSEQPEAGWGLIDFLSPSQVERWIRERVIMPTSTTRCQIPAGIFAGTDGAMGRLVAYGPELNRAAPGQNPEWTMRLRLMSSGMTMLGEDQGRRGRGGSGSGGSGSGNPLGNPVDTILRGIFR